MRCGGQDRCIHASRAIEHPGRNLKPPSGIGAAQRAAEYKVTRLVELLMDKDRQTEPWMPPIQNLAKAGPVGVSTHLSLNKDAPVPGGVEWAGNIVCRPILGGLHHQYGRI
jgi:hypothetical protein